MRAPRDMGRCRTAAACLFVVCAADLLTCAVGGERTHKYQLGERVNLWVNKVGPYSNPQAWYPYYHLPYCVPDLGIGNRKKRAGIGEVLAGNELRNSGLPIQFMEEKTREDVCSVYLSEDSSNQLQKAVEENYFYNMYLDDLPIWGKVGDIGHNGVAEVYGHRIFSISYNDNKIIQVNITSGGAQDVVPGSELQFSYEVHWVPTKLKFEDRFDRYLESGFFENQIHWFSILNSFMLVVFLCGLVALILVRTLRNDFAKYTKDDDDFENVTRALVDESGWKQVHGDVFRAPAYLVVFSALYGTGWQLITLVAGVILFAIAGPLHGDVYEERGEMVTTFIVCYALTSGVAGFASGTYYRQFFTTPRAEQTSQWQHCMLLTVLILPAAVVSVLSVLNSVAMYYDTINTIPLSVMVKMFLIWMFVSFPLVILGSMLGRHWGGKPSFPCRVNSIQRPIPVGPWYTQPWAIVPISGVLPFGSIFIEMYFIFTSFWNYKFYYVYGFMLLVYGILMVVLICTSIVSVYVLLNAENYHWQWVSFLSSGSTAAYIFLYSIYYFCFKTEMFGFLQTSFYFGYMGLFCLSMFLLCGTIGVIGSSIFVKHIYRNVKID